jgi:outer membrane immunogenic protein
MWRGFGLIVVALAVMSPAAAQVAPTLQLRGGAQPNWNEPIQGRIYGIDVSAAATDTTTQIGFDRRFGGWVMGVKGDWSSGQNCLRYDPANPNAICSAFNWQSAAAGRIGYAWDRVTAFTQGGALFSQWDRSALSGDNRTGLDGTRNVSTGWMLGGGLEYAVGGNWSLRAEYNYFDYGRPDPSSPSAFTNSGEPLDARSHMLMFGLKRRM